MVQLLIKKAKKQSRKYVLFNWCCCYNYAIDLFIHPCIELILHVLFQENKWQAEEEVVRIPPLPSVSGGGMRTLQKSKRS